MHCLWPAPPKHTTRQSDGKVTQTKTNLPGLSPAKAMVAATATPAPATLPHTPTSKILYTVPGLTRRQAGKVWPQATKSSKAYMGLKTSLLPAPPLILLLLLRHHCLLRAWTGATHASPANLIQRFAHAEALGAPGVAVDVLERHLLLAAYVEHVGVHAVLLHLELRSDAVEVLLQQLLLLASHLQQQLALRVGVKAAQSTAHILVLQEG